MANEATVLSGLNILTGNLNYRPPQQQFQGNVTGAFGPVPGAVLIATAPGTSILLTGIIVPGYCKISNIDQTNFVTIGIWDGTHFFPMLEVRPNESYVVRLSRELGNEYGTGTGTGTVGSGMVLRAVADTAAVKLVVEAFEA